MMPTFGDGFGPLFPVMTEVSSPRTECILIQVGGTKVSFKPVTPGVTRLQG